MHGLAGLMRVIFPKPNLHKVSWVEHVHLRHPPGNSQAAEQQSGNPCIINNTVQRLLLLHCTG